MKAEGQVVDVWIRVTQGDALGELASLWEWLLDEELLRGYVSPVEQPVGMTELGSGLDMLTVVLTSGGTAMALARALTTWLGTRRSDVKIRVSTADGGVEIAATNLKDARPTLEQALQALDGNSPD